MPVRILVIDDVASVRRLVRACLESADIDTEIIEAANGEAAIKVLDSQEVDIVLSDHRMGAITGLQVLKHALARQPDALRCMMTGYADPDLVVAATTEAKVHVFVEKPMEGESFARVLEREVLGRYQRMYDVA